VDNNNNDNINNQPWGRKETLPYILTCIVKFRLNLTSNLITKREGKREREVPVT
jgi:hypothetical protein